MRRAIVVGYLWCFLQSAVSIAVHCPLCAAALTPRLRLQRPAGGGRLLTMLSGSSDEDSEWTPEASDLDKPPQDEPFPWKRELETLAERMISVKSEYELAQKFEALSSAWVLVFDPETDEEAVYSMQIEEGAAVDEAHVVLAFEDVKDAERYALSLTEEPYSTPPTVQELDFEALVVTSRDASFGVAVVFKGDLGEYLSLDDLEVPIFASDTAASLSVSITMVPSHLFADKSAADYIDPAEDPIWVLVHDAHTSDAQYFSMMLNGSDSIVCFRDEESAHRCGRALQSTGALRGPSTQAVLLEDLLSSLSEETEVCLIDEVVEQTAESDEADAEDPSIIASYEKDGFIGSVQPSRSSATPSHVLMALERLYETVNASAVDGDFGASR